MMYNSLPQNILLYTRKKFFSTSNNKYNNNYEISDIQFSEKEGKIKMNLIKNLDFSTLLEPKNNILLKKIIDNLITSEISYPDYEINKSSLFKLFQNSLEYLVVKKKRIIQVNNELKKDIKQIEKRTNEIENELNEKKEIIKNNSKIKKDEKLKYEEIKKKYEEMKQKQKKENSNKNEENERNKKVNVNNIIIEHNIKIENQTEIENKNNIEDIKDNKENLKSQNAQKKFKNKKKFDFDLYLKEIDDLENYLNDLIIKCKFENQKENKIEEDNIIKENNRHIKEFIEYQKKMNEDFTNLTENYYKEQNEFYIKLINILKYGKDGEEIKKERELLENNNEVKEAIQKNSISEELLKNLKDSIEKLKELLKREYKIKNAKNQNELIYLKQKLKYLSIIPETNDNENEEDKNNIFNKEFFKEEEKEKVSNSDLDENKNEINGEDKETNEKEGIKKSKKDEETNEKEGIKNSKKDEETKKSRDKNENKEISFEIKREIKTNEEDKEKKNIEFFNNFFKSNNINIYGNFNNMDNNQNNKFIIDRELSVQKDKKLDTNQFIFNFK